MKSTCVNNDESSVASREDWWDKISEAEKAAIDKGIEDAENGKITPHEKVRKRYEKWL